MNNQKYEIVFNFWYIMDKNGYIYELRARRYLLEGTDQEKLTFLQKYAQRDYLISDEFLLPEKYATAFFDTDQDIKIPLVHYNDAMKIIGLENLFEEVYEYIEGQIPFDSEYSIPENPLRVITPIKTEEDGRLKLIINEDEELIFNVEKEQ